jgi:hypothetical protein
MEHMWSGAGMHLADICEGFRYLTRLVEYFQEKRSQDHATRQVSAVCVQSKWIVVEVEMRSSKPHPIIT